MQNIIVEKPYKFIPPRNGNWFATFLLQKVRLHSLYNRFAEGVVSHECRHLERLRESIQAGHGILIAANHSRTADPPAIGWLCEEVPCLVYGMASWHLFEQSWLARWVLRSVGAFSVNREAVDRQAIDTAIRILTEAKRPLVVFPEGATSRTNDHLKPLLPGVGCILRAAARRRSRLSPAAKVVVHPVAIKYHLLGDIVQVAERGLSEIEKHIAWSPQRHLPLLERVARLGNALLSLKETEYLGRDQTGTVPQRLGNLIAHLLEPVEREWIGEPQSGPTLARVRVLRSLILAKMVEDPLEEAEHSRCWRQLEDLYLAQQLGNYVPNYLCWPSIDRIFETIEKFEEDLTDRLSRHPPLHCVIDVGEAMDVASSRVRRAADDPIVAKLHRCLQGMLDDLAKESRMYTPNSSGSDGAACPFQASRSLPEAANQASDIGANRELN